MKPADYDETDQESILEFAMGLSGRSLAQVADVSDVTDNVKSKGNLGNLVEELYFRISPDNTSSLPDFSKAGLELKTAGVVPDGANGSYRAKERLVLTMINYMKIIDESWATSTLLAKCHKILILLYLYEKDIPVVQRRFVYHPFIWDFPGEDLAVISADWEFIANKVRAGLAHELSEGDTRYLAACTKSADGTKLTRQPNSQVPAKPRAFSLKARYVTTIINRKGVAAGSITEADQTDFEAVAAFKLSHYFGMEESEIGRVIGYQPVKKPKNYRSALAVRMLGVKEDKVLEFEKADIQIKTVRLKPNGIPKEDMSFRTFEYLGIVSEEWEESKFFEDIERRFLFVVFQDDADGKTRFVNAKFWTMPYEDRLEAERVWRETRSRISQFQAETLPLKSFSHVAHVRPKAKDSSDVLPTPQGDMLVRKCFWLNAAYISEQVR